MNHSNPWTLPALVIGAVFAAAIIGVTVYAIITERGDVARHRHQPRHTHRAVPFADPADHSDPDGGGYVGQLLQARALTDDDWWDQAPPPPPAPTWDATPAAAARLLEALRGPDDPLSEPCPECQHWVCGCDTHIDTTGVQPHAVLTWGMTPEQVTSKLAAEYLT